MKKTIKRKQIPKGTIEINLSGRRLGDKDIPGKSGKFDTAEEAAAFYENERVPQKRKKK